MRNLTDLLGRAGGIGRLTAEQRAQLVEAADYLTMEQIRQRIDESVRDPALAARLKPWYHQYCKRPTFSDTYLAAFNRPSVTLIDVSDARGIERVTPRGVVANGVEHEVDCIIYATGFEVTSDFHRRLGIDVAGQNGLSLYEHWAEGMRAFQGHSMSGFPNLFLVGGLFAFLLTPNYCSVVDEQAEHVAYIVAQTIERGARTVRPTPDAEQAWIDHMRDAPRSPAMRSTSTCTPGYYSREGQRITNRSIRQELYSRGPSAFSAALREWRGENLLAGLELR